MGGGSPVQTLNETLWPFWEVLGALLGLFIRGSKSFLGKLNEPFPYLERLTPFLVLKAIEKSAFPISWTFSEAKPSLTNNIILSLVFLSLKDDIFLDLVGHTGRKS